MLAGLEHMTELSRQLALLLSVGRVQLACGLLGIR